MWEEEFSKFADFNYNLAVLNGSGAKKADMLRNLSGTHVERVQQLQKDHNSYTDAPLQVAVVNYESAWRLETEIREWKPDLIVCDEGHKIKTHNISTSKAMHRLGALAAYRLLLTGTVITNKALDVFSQYKFLNATIFGNSFYTFRNRYFDMVGYGNHIPVLKKSMEPELTRRLHCIAFRATKAECLDLPAVTDIIRSVELEPAAMKVYRDLVKESYAELANCNVAEQGIDAEHSTGQKQGVDREHEAGLDHGAATRHQNDTDQETQSAALTVTATNILTRLLRLSQLTGGFIGAEQRDAAPNTPLRGEMIPISKAKLNALSDILEQAQQDGKKLVIIARFVPEIKAICAMLEKAGIGYSCIMGGVADRNEQVSRFQTDPDCQVFVGQIATAGLGITLTAASTLVFYSTDYSMSNHEQARARIHRVGQRENCTYIYLVAKGTVDEKVLKALHNKADLAKTLVDDYRKGLNPYG